MAIASARTNIKIVAFDPGVTTGYAYGTIKGTEFEFYGCGEFRFTYLELYNLLESISPLYVVAEGFEYRNSSRQGLVLESRNILGVLELWCQIRDRRFRTQSAYSGKSHFSDDKLRRKGVYKKGAGHARDATRHLLRFIEFGEGSRYVTNDNYKINK